ncbi:hypothetical protein PISMIDRAFT_50471, partial [Pisolithus microcarpus 441]
HYMGLMNIQCPNCHALHFLCGTPSIQQWPRILQDLFDDPQDQREFRKYVHQYNNALAFTSVGVEVDRQTVQGAGPASFHIHGTLHNLMGALMPPQGLQPSYAQLYIYDPQEATNTCLQRNPDFQGDILLDLHTTLREHHPYAAVYQSIMQAKPPEQHT